MSEVRLTIPCVCMANKRHAHSRRRGREVRVSPDYRRFRSEVAAAVMAGRVPSFDAGPVGMAITTHYPRMRHLGDKAKHTHVPFGDVDATAKATLDALQSAGVFDDDVRVVNLYLTKKHTGKAEAWLEVRIWSEAA